MGLIEGNKKIKEDNVKVKHFFVYKNFEEFEKELNEFIKDKKVIDIKHSISSYSSVSDYSYATYTDMSFLVMYEDKE